MNRNLNPDEFGYPEPTGLSEDRVPSALRRWDVDPDTMMDVYESADTSKASEERVPLASLLSYQTDVERPSLEHLAASSTLEDAPPLDVIRRQEQLILRDGSHRANAALLRGLPDFRANVKEASL